MDSRPTGGGGSTSAVRVFTVFVLSGSLFLLIYNVGRRRMNTRTSHSLRETTPPMISNPSSLRGYFSHHKDKPSTRRRKPSLTSVLDPLSTTSVEGNDSWSDHTDHAAATPDDPKEVVEKTPSVGPRGSNSCNYDAETGPYMVTRSYSSAFQPSSSNAEPSSSTTGHEVQMIEHMKRSGRFSDSQESGSKVCLDSGQRRSSSSVLGDMSQLETSPRPGMDSQSIPDMPSVSVKADVQNDDPFGQRVSPIERDSTVPRAQFFKPLIYIFIWCALSYTCHVYSSTGWGAKIARFPAPFLKNAVLFLMQAIMSSCMLRWPRNTIFVMPWNTYTFIVAPIATAVALDHDLQDASVYMVALGMPTLNRPTGILGHAYMMLSSFKDTTLETVWDARMQSRGYVPLCAFLFALAFRLESRNIAIALSIAVIAVGFILGVSTGTKFGVTTLKERSFGPLLSGFRWAAIQLLLQKREIGVVTPVVTMRALSPSMAIVAALISVFAEPWRSLFTIEEYFDNQDQALMSCAHIVIGALLGTAVALAELVVIYHTSALTLITLGMLKDFCLVVPRMIDNSQFSEQNIVGMIVFSIGLVSFIWLKYQKLMNYNRIEASSEDTQSVASGTSMDRWPSTGASDFTTLASQAQHVTDYFGRAQTQHARGYFQGARDVGTRVSRKILSLWELAF